MGSPDSNGKNGRGANGRFLPGNSGGPGNPKLRALAKFRDVIAENTDPEKIKLAWKSLQEQAANGEPWAIKELLDRVYGKSAQVLVVDGKDDATAGFREWFEEMMQRPRVVRAIEAEVLDKTG